MTRALVIGGTGFVGGHVVEALRESGCAVTVCTRRSAPGFSEFLAPPLPDVVFHMGAMNQDDARLAAEAFEGRVGRFVAASSGDVYLAYGRFTGLEPGPPQPMPLTERSELRGKLFPYRASASSEADALFRYEKILVERELLGRRALNAAIVRLAKVYGAEKNADFATVRAYANRPHWRWTHAYVENVAAAIVLVGLHPVLPRPVYNVGEPNTPTVAERLRDLPPSQVRLGEQAAFDFRQDMVLDSTAIRADLGYAEPVPYREGLRRTLAGAAQRERGFRAGPSARC